MGCRFGPRYAARDTVALMCLFCAAVDINQLRGPGDIITEPDAVNNVVSIDGRRTYFDLSPTDTSAGGTYQVRREVERAQTEMFGANTGLF